MLPVPCAENMTALRNGLDVTLVLLGGTKSLPNILGLVDRISRLLVKTRGSAFFYCLNVLLMGNAVIHHKCNLTFLLLTTLIALKLSGKIDIIYKQGPIR
nr:unnamed protein product [Callosobruchus analis]